MSRIFTDILIIGGGPAGSTTALFLSELGLDITLIEKKNFPREVLCGEFLSKEVTDIMKELNIYNDFLSLNPIKLNSFRAIDDSGIELNSTLNFNAYALKRSVFDSFLLEKVKLRNVKIIQPGVVISVFKSNSVFVVEVILENYNKILVESKLVIAAYGKQNILDKKLERNFVNKKSNLNGIKLHLPIDLLEEKFDDEIRIYTDKELYCGINKVNAKEVTICFLENRSQLKIPSRQKLIEAIRSNKNFKSIFSDDAVEYIKSTNIYGTGKIFFGKRRVVEKGIIMVGDAAQVIAPLAGDGIGMAMESAKILFTVIGNYGLLKTEKLFSEYNRHFTEAFSSRVKTAKLIQSIVLNQTTRKISFNIAAKFPSILPYLIKFTRNAQTP